MKKLLSAAALGISIASLLGVSPSFQARAQTADNVLRGVSKIRLSIDSLGEDSASCGLTRDLIRDAVRHATGAVRFQMITDPDKEKGPRPDALLYVKVNTLFFKTLDLCVSNVSVQAYATQALTLTSSHRAISAEVGLWDEGSGMGSSSRAEHADYVSQMIDKNANKFINDWNLDNRDEK